MTAGNTLADLDGIPASGAGSIAYQWKADGSAIEGATAKTLALGISQAGKAITVTASYTDNFGTAESKSSNPTTAVAYVNGIPSDSIVTNPDGSSLKTEYDLNNTKPWAQQTSFYDTQGRLSWIQTQNDNDSFDQQDEDQDNTNAWKEQATHLDALGRLD